MVSRTECLDEAVVLYPKSVMSRAQELWNKQFCSHTLKKKTKTKKNPNVKSIERGSKDPQGSRVCLVFHDGMLRLKAPLPLQNSMICINISRGPEEILRKQTRAKPIWMTI